MEDALHWTGFRPDAKSGFLCPEVFSAPSHFTNHCISCLFILGHFARVCLSICWVAFEPYESWCVFHYFVNSICIWIQSVSNCEIIAPNNFSIRCQKKHLHKTNERSLLLPQPTSKYRAAQNLVQALSYRNTLLKASEPQWYPFVS